MTPWPGHFLPGTGQPPPVPRTYERCRAAGLDRHAAVHALASVVTHHMAQVLEQQKPLDQTVADRDFDALDPAAFSRKRRT